MIAQGLTTSRPDVGQPFRRPSSRPSHTWYFLVIEPGEVALQPRVVALRHRGGERPVFRRVPASRNVSTAPPPVPEEGFPATPAPHRGGGTCRTAPQAAGRLRFLERP